MAGCNDCGVTTTYGCVHSLLNPKLRMGRRPLQRYNVQDMLEMDLVLMAVYDILIVAKSMLCSGGISCLITAGSTQEEEHGKHAISLRSWRKGSVKAEEGLGRMLGDRLRMEKALHIKLSNIKDDKVVRDKEAARGEGKAKDIIELMAEMARITALLGISHMASNPDEDLSLWRNV